MKQKKTLKILATAFATLALGIGVASCSPKVPNPVDPIVDPVDENEAKIKEIYNLAVSAGATTLSYEEWLESIRGEDGNDGLTPYIGTNGNWWIGNTDTHVPATGPQGPAGQNGEDGQDGQPGQNGQDGQDGKPGEKGADGSSLLYGNGIPSSNLGNIGDSYIDLSTWNFWVKNKNGWSLAGNIKGSDGVGENGLSAYQIYCNAHPEYNKTEAEWLDDLINGRLGNQQIHTVTFDSLGGSDVASQQVLHGEKATKPTNPTRSGYDFMGWADENGDKWVFNGYSITSDITLFAMWEATNPSHIHTFSDSWTYNDTHHWHQANCGHDEQADYEEHTFIDTVIAPTTTSQGYTHHACACGYSYNDNYVPAIVDYQITISASASTLEVGATVTINVVASPLLNFTYELNDGRLVIENSNPSVVSFNNGTFAVTALAEGTSTIRFVYDNRCYSNKLTFTVTDNTTPPSEVVSIDFYAMNDLHGNVKDSDTGLGIAKTTTLLKQEMADDENSILISSGDMWQGSFESNTTRGRLVNDWMEQVGFSSMTYGNHEFDWGTDHLNTIANEVKFDMLGINILYRSNNERVPYAKASTIVEKDGARIGIIGAEGNCLSSITKSVTADIYFATESTSIKLSDLVKAESLRLRNEEGCDFIVYSLHGDPTNDNSEIYEPTLGTGDAASNYKPYVDVVLEGHKHKEYTYFGVNNDGIYHIQGGGYNKTIEHFQISLNKTTDEYTYTIEPHHYKTLDYSSLIEDETTNLLFTQKYKDELAGGDVAVGYNSENRNSNVLNELVAQLYYEKGVEKWGSSYDIQCGGGYIAARSPYKLEAGDVTYAKLYALYPFDNDVVLCTISGSKLKKEFLDESTREGHYHVTAKPGLSISDINDSDTYYVVTDTYSSDYHELEVIDNLDFFYFARDMLKDYAANGGFNNGGGNPVQTLTGNGTLDNPYTISDAYQLAQGKTSSDAVWGYFKGTFSSVPSPNSDGILQGSTITDGEHSMNVFKLHRCDGDSTLINKWTNDNIPSIGEEIVFAGSAYEYNSLPQFGGVNIAVTINNGSITGASIDDPMTFKQYSLAFNSNNTVAYSHLSDVYVVGYATSVSVNNGLYTMNFGSDASINAFANLSTHCLCNDIALASGLSDVDITENSKIIIHINQATRVEEIVQAPSAGEKGKAVDNPLSASEAYQYAFNGTTGEYFVQGSICNIVSAMNTNGFMTVDLDAGNGNVFRVYSLYVGEDNASYVVKGNTIIAQGALELYNSNTPELNGATYCSYSVPSEFLYADITGNNTVTVGSTIQLTANLYPVSLGTRTFAWQSSNSSVANVGPDGSVTGVSAGNATITATYQGFTVTYNIVVLAAGNHGLNPDSPLSALEAKNLASGLGSGATTSDLYYITGTITSIKTAYSSQYDNITFYIDCGDGTAFLVYRMNGGSTLQAGDVVVICAKLTNYQGTTPETTQSGSFIYAINGIIQ